MDVIEHEGKQLLARFGARVPRGILARNPAEAMAAARSIGPCAVKAQVLRGGRGKAGLIKLAKTAEEAGRIAADLLSLRREDDVDLLLIEEKLDIRAELYLSIKVDDVSGAPLVIASAEGGVNIEEQKEALAFLTVDVLKGLRRYEAIDLWKRAGLNGTRLQRAVDTTMAAWKAFSESDATLVEINPLVFDASDNCWVADTKLSIDDSALWRHPEWTGKEGKSKGTALEQRASRLGINSFIELDGSIAVVCAGASFGMMLSDAIHAAGGRPANFMDMGGLATPFAREKIVQMVSANTGGSSPVRAILIAMIQTSKPIAINIDAITGALARQPAACPVLCWLGTGHIATQELSLEAAYARLEAAGVRTFYDVREAVAAAVEVANSGAANSGAANAGSANLTGANT